MTTADILSIRAIALLSINKKQSLQGFSKTHESGHFTMQIQISGTAPIWSPIRAPFGNWTKMFLVPRQVMSMPMRKAH